MRRRDVVAEKQGGDQTATATTAIVTREVPAARIKSAKPPEISVTRNIAVATENTTGTLPEIGNDNDISLVISCARFDPRFPFAHVIGRSKIRVPISAPDLQAAEFVDQEEVHDAGDRVGSVHSRGAILENVYVIDHHERDQID